MGHPPGARPAATAPAHVPPGASGNPQLCWLWNSNKYQQLWHTYRFFGLRPFPRYQSIGAIPGQVAVPPHWGSPQYQQLWHTYRFFGLQPFPRHQSIGTIPRQVAECNHIHIMPPPMNVYWIAGWGGGGGGCASGHNTSSKTACIRPPSAARYGVVDTRRPGCLCE